MKILVEYSQYAPYNPHRFSNGVERWTSNVISLLREGGHEVTVLSVAGGVEEEGVIVTPISPRTRGKNERFPLLKWYSTIDKLARDHDRVLLTTQFSSTKFATHQSYLHKVIYIEHYPHALTRNLFNHVHWFNLRLIQRCGGYAYAPNQWAIDTAQKSYENRKEDRKFRPVFGNDDFYRDAIEENFPNLYSGIFEIPMMMNIVEQLPPVNPKKVMWVGRCVKEKDALRAMEAMVELSKRGYECHYFTENVTQEKVSLFGAINKAREKSEVFFHLNKNAREIDSHYADSNVLLWPTRDETVGLVGIEGAIHGCRVVFTLDLCKNTLPSEYAFHREWKTSAEMADAVEEVMNEPFDREGCARYFRERYSREECIARLNELFEREPNPDYGRNAVFMTETLRELIEEYRAKNPVH